MLNPNHVGNGLAKPIAQQMQAEEDDKSLMDDLPTDFEKECRWSGHGERNIQCEV
jgi:hypothetical protein